MTAITKIIRDHLIHFYCIWETDILYHSKVLNSLITCCTLKEYSSITAQLHQAGQMLFREFNV